MAHTLGIRPKTAATHIERIYAKTAVTNRASATRFAIQHRRSSSATHLLHGLARGHAGVLLAGPLTASALVPVAWLTYDNSRPDTFGRRFADRTLQLALIVVLGAVVKVLMDDYGRFRDKREATAVKQADLLRRLRSQHVRVATAQRLIKAHESGRTYTEQLRALMLVVPELEEIAEDVKAGESLFSADDAEAIVAGVEELVRLLNEGADEYVRLHPYVNTDARAGKALEVTTTAHHAPWLSEFLDPFPNLPVRYDEGLMASKGILRSYVYRESRSRAAGRPKTASRSG